MILVAFGILVMVVGIAINLYGKKLRRPFEEYEFQNRTDGGVVKFESLKASKRHQRKKSFTGAVEAVGILIGGLGFFIAVFFLGMLALR